MYSKGSVEGAVLVYIVILIVMIIIIIFVLQVFTPYKITNLVGELLNSSEGINYAHFI
ncbi:MAG: hypothetical protein OH316_01345 [Candidatus Parvarchaeota archaeon]|nr:hypothetical protein [Candidatus Parvarchaeota archaeon]